MRLPMQMWKRTLIALGFSPADSRRSGGQENRQRRLRRLGVEPLESRALLAAVSLSASTSITEGSPVFVTVMLDEPSEDTVGVYYSTADGSATAGDDYQALSGSIWFAPGETQSSFAIGTNDDSEDENNETFSVSLSGAVGADLGSPTSATITIHDNDGPPPPPPTPTIYLSVSGSVLEGNSAQITATLNAASDEWVTLSYATSDGSATSPADYQETSDAVSFAPGSTQASFVISTVDDSDIEPNEAFSLVFGQPSGAVLGSSSSYSITILASDTPPPPPPSPAIHLSASGSVTEGGWVNVTLTLDPPSDQPVSVHYATSDETAASGSDYNDTSGDISFAPYQTQASFTVYTNDESDPEPNETFSVYLSDATGADLAWPSSATITILANDGYQPPRTIYMDVGAPVTEGGQANVTLTIDPPSDQWASVHYATSDGTATSGSDYSGASGDVSFSPYQTQASFTVYTYDDSDPEPSEMFSVSLTGATGVDLASPSSATITILDNDGYTPTISISASGSATEGNPAQLTLTLDAPAPETISLPYSTADGDAVSPTDYEGVTNGTVTFAPGATQATITILTHEDPTSTNDKTFTVNFLPPTNALLGPVTSATITIHNNAGCGSGGGSGGGTQPEVFLAEVQGIPEINDGWITVQLSHDWDQTVSVNFELQGITATAGDDFYLEGAPSGVFSGTLTFACQEVSQSFGIMSVNDNLIEGNESLQIVLSSPVNATLGTPSTATTWIMDDDEVGIDLTSSQELVVVNDDDDNDNEISDAEDTSVPDDDELVEVFTTINAPTDTDLTGYEVEFVTTGPFALWQSNKAIAVPSGSTFPAAEVPTLFAEATQEGSGEIIARLLQPGGAEAARKSWRLEGTGVHLRRDGADIELVKQTVWVGEKINLEAAGANIRTVRWIGLQEAIKNWGQEDGGPPSDTFAKAYSLTEQDLATREIQFYWYQGGNRRPSVGITISAFKLPGREVEFTVLRRGNFDVKRPTANMFATVDQQGIRIYPVGSKTIVQLGRTQDPALPKDEGIIFSGGPVNNAGVFMWVQLINTDERLDTVAGIFRKQTPEFVLDGPPLWHESQIVPLGGGISVSATNDSPFSELATPASGLLSLRRQTEYRMFLMWQPSTAGSIPVPMRYLDWTTDWTVQWNAGTGKWDLIGKELRVMESEDATGFPQWRYNVRQFEFVPNP